MYIILFVILILFLILFLIKNHFLENFENLQLFEKIPNLNWIKSKNECNDIATKKCQFVKPEMYLNDNSNFQEKSSFKPYQNEPLIQSVNLDCWNEINKNCNCSYKNK